MSMKKLIICEVCFDASYSDEEIEKIQSLIHTQVKAIVGNYPIYVDTSIDETDYDI